jgi:hypothetical protein
MTKFILFGAVLIVYLAAMIFVLLTIKKEKKRNSHIISPDEARVYRRDYACPKCNSIMEKGFTLAARGLTWCDSEDDFVGNFFKLTPQRLDNTANWGLTLRANSAWKCDTCNLVLIDHGALIGK